MYDDAQDVRHVLGSPQQSLQSGTWTGAAEEDPTYRLLLDCLGLVVSIDNEVASIHNYIKDKYKDKFPELASFVHDPVQYARTIQLIGNEMDLTKINLEDVLQQVSLLCFWLWWISDCAVWHLFDPFGCFFSNAVFFADSASSLTSVASHIVTCLALTCAVKCFV